jgi:phosphoribosylglycinamide formyltransferase-1
LKRVAVLVSGGGSNLQALIDAINAGRIKAQIVLVISNKLGVYALERASRNGIPSLIIPTKDRLMEEYSRQILERLQREQIDLICLAGFTRILSPEVAEAFPNRILNIHPSLLPAFGGKGMYGLRVHQAVLESGAKFTGATVHLVTANTDQGPIVCQDVLRINDEDTPETLAQRVLEIEHRIYPQALKILAEQSLEIKGFRTWSQEFYK